MRTTEMLAEAWREGRDFAVRRIEQQIADGYPERLSLGEKCAHGVLSGHECIGCYDEALLTALTNLRGAEPTSSLLAVITGADGTESNDGA